VCVDDTLLARLMEHASKPLQFALRLAHLTGQRPADVYRVSETDIRDGRLFVKQGKVKTKLRIVIEVELKQLLDEMLEHKRQFSVRPLALIVIENGQP
jgi:integrase